MLYLRSSISKLRALVIWTQMVSSRKEFKNYKKSLHESCRDSATPKVWTDNNMMVLRALEAIWAALHHGRAKVTPPRTEVAIRALGAVLKLHMAPRLTATLVEADGVKSCKNYSGSTELLEKEGT